MSVLITYENRFEVIALIEKQRRGLGTRRIVIFILFIAISMYGNYKRVEKLDENLIKEISYWIPIVEEKMNREMSISDKQKNDIIDKVDDTVEINKRSRTELEYMGNFGGYVTYVYLYKYYVAKGNQELAKEAKSDYKYAKHDLKMKLSEYRDKYEYVNELWNVGVFEE
tara:strand:+ start:142 stop:648 length:507 start_codon:yes stop_codon:yes gene_type:complete